MSKTTEKILILSTDFLTINLAWIVYFILRVQTGWFKLLTVPEFPITMMVMYFYWVIIFTFVGMYRTWFAASRFDELATLFKASFVGIFILFFLIFLDDYRLGVSSSTRILIFIYWGLFLVFVGSGRLLVRSIQRSLLIKGYGRKNALIVGFNKKAHEVHDQILQYKALGLDIKGYISVNGTSIGKEYKETPVLGFIDETSKVIDDTNAKEIIIALDKSDNDILVDLIARCEPKNVGLKIVPDLYEILSGQAKTSQIYGLPLIDIMPQLMPEWEKKIKRIIDVVVSFLSLIITLPVAIPTALAIKLETEGPVFFKQTRCGMNDTVFKIIKFRSMYNDAEKLTGPVWSQKDDPRITKVGRIIRKVRIDEIPQMYNVLKGEMSLVGPRPERPYFVEMLSNIIKED